MYACWPFAMLHGITAGTDASTPWVRGIYAVCAAAIFGAVAWRVTAALTPPAPPRRPSPETRPRRTVVRSQPEPARKLVGTRS